MNDIVYMQRNICDDRVAGHSIQKYKDQNCQSCVVKSTSIKRSTTSKHSFSFYRNNVHFGNVYQKRHDLNVADACCDDDNDDDEPVSSFSWPAQNSCKSNGYDHELPQR
jgi:hypothetical protein